ncbi:MULTISPECIES: peptide ABC transporter substrate-binding protein [Staphylococcus]|uniref:peptide ABC transporter substrate-binding protein n=1 Tax=Staphylococcus TaxID=1279 RepID=UPI00066E418A|nr:MULTISPECIES: peptide ABC transporter substrate-binding protein [Staphylococcus]MBC3048294.1 peptide ABC transporter substrate-binding protein [Staphylococcus capitis]MBC3068919.1 peptide ABC transporter substrate-binding protein [Staphylococcus capitis]MBC3071105.1 peptide ABC transporter substrate-binding protein [Staphylococcus capitis]MBC3081388.1 peptide ABC transporter substrate-binding protein [Staphylococcus capitis]MBO0371256.1 peptide ABC transporter substrate-binding protein [Sta
MELNKYFRTTIILVISILILSSCSQNKGMYSDEGQVFRKVIPQDMTTLDTAMITDSVSNDIAEQAFEGLFSLDKNDKATLAIAKNMPKKSKDGKTLIFDLKENAKWSNGDDVTANDFVYAWRKVVNPKTGSEYAYIMTDIKNADDINAGKKPVESLGIKAINKHKLEIQLNRPIPYINELLTLSTFYPQNEKISKKYGEKYGTKVEKTVFNGPFKVDKWKHEDKILLSKNNNYWDKKNVKLEKVNYKVLKDKQVGASLYETGSIDDTLITADQVNKYKDSPALKKRITSGNFYIKLNQKKVKEFSNKNLRLAIARSINKQGYVDAVKNDGSSPSNTLTAKGVAKVEGDKDYTSTINSPLDFNPKLANENWQKAKKELKIEKFTFTMNTEDTPDAKISAEYIKSQVEKNLPGITLKIKQLPFKQRIALETKMNYEASLSGWGADYSDPTSYLGTMTKDNPQNNTGWNNTSFDNSYNEVNGKLLKYIDKRNETMKNMEELLVSDAPIAPIYQKGEAHLTNPQVKGLIYHVVGPDTTLKNVYIDKSVDRNTGKKKN